MNVPVPRARAERRSNTVAVAVAGAVLVAGLGSMFAIHGLQGGAQKLAGLFEPAAQTTVARTGVVPAARPAGEERLKVSYEMSPLLKGHAAAK